MSAFAHLERHDFLGQARLRAVCLHCGWSCWVDQEAYVGQVENAALLAAAKGGPAQAAAGLKVGTVKITRSDAEMQRLITDQVRSHLVRAHQLHGRIAIEADAFVFAGGSE